MTDKNDDPKNPITYINGDGSKSGFQSMEELRSALSGREEKVPSLLEEDGDITDGYIAQKGMIYPRHVSDDSQGESFVSNGRAKWMRERTTHHSSSRAKTRDRTAASRDPSHKDFQIS